MGKQKSSGWLDQFISKVPKTFGKEVVTSDRAVDRVMPSDPTKLTTQAQRDAKEAKERRDRINVANATQDQEWSSPKNFAVSTSAIADKLRVSDFPNSFDDSFFNPIPMIGHAASALGRVPLNIKQGNYGQATWDVAAPYAFGAVETLLAPIISKGVRSGRTAIDQNFTQVGKQLTNIEKEGIAKGLSPHEIKMQQMDQVGITSTQREGYVPGVSEIATEYITPYSYDKPVKRILDIPRRIIKGEKNSKYLSDVNADFIFNQDQLVAKPRYDAWRMYSGLPQKYGTFRMAETSPINHPSYPVEQLSKLEKFSLNNERKLLSDLPSEYDVEHLAYADRNELIDVLPHLESKLQDIHNIKNKGIDIGNDYSRTNVMGGYNRRYFNDKMEYNDIWDLDLKGTPVDKYFGKPFMSHGQLDYSFQPAEDAISQTIRKAKHYQKLGRDINKSPNFMDVDAFDKATKQILPQNLKNQVVSKKYKDGGWLDKYDDGGPVQPNYNDASVSMSDDFVGMGNDTTGRNYSPAWGGQFAMGGSMPGAVGFMYARTNDPAPSKGPYGKKTPASAQNGTEMSFYQNGLDWKPKTISKDGTTIYNPKTKIGFDKTTAKEYIAVPPKPVATPDYNMFDKFVLGTDAFVKDALDYKTYLKGFDMVAGSAIKGLRNLGVPVPDAAKEFFFNKVRPVSYPTDLISAAREILRSDKAPPARDSSGNLRVDEEAWSMAMGRPTQSKYIVPSKYKPSSAKDPNAKYHTFAKGVIDPKVLTDLVSDDKFWNKYKQVNKSGKEYLPSVSLEPYLTDSFKKEYIKTANDEFSQTDPLANFQIYRGVDPKTKKKYAAISDVYDFGLETANALTNPINFYDRFYYKDGGPIKDDRGQWAHPGEITEIGSNQITMQGVPYPVLGISDTGDMQMMYPNQEYQYDGSSVTEYPMMAQGGQLTKLDQLTNFTNYNTKQPGGWLDKYQ